MYERVPGLKSLTLLLLGPPGLNERIGRKNANNTMLTTAKVQPDSWLDANILDANVLDANVQAMGGGTKVWNSANDPQRIIEILNDSHLITEQGRVQL